MEGDTEVTRVALIGLNQDNELMDEPNDPTVPPITPIPGCPPDCKVCPDYQVDFEEAKTYLKQLVIGNFPIQQ
jgi:hypothetical protein